MGEPTRDDLLATIENLTSALTDSRTQLARALAELNRVRDLLEEARGDCRAMRRALARVVRASQR